MILVETRPVALMMAVRGRWPRNVYAYVAFDTELGLYGIQVRHPNGRRTRYFGWVYRESCVRAARKELSTVRSGTWTRRLSEFIEHPFPIPTSVDDPVLREGVEEMITARILEQPDRGIPFEDFARMAVASRSLISECPETERPALIQMFEVLCAELLEQVRRQRGTTPTDLRLGATPTFEPRRHEVFESRTRYEALVADDEDV